MNFIKDDSLCVVCKKKLSIIELSFGIYRILHNQMQPIGRQLKDKGTYVSLARTWQKQNQKAC